MFVRISFLTILSFSILAQFSPVRIATLSSGIGSSTYLQPIGQSSVVIGTQVVGNRYIIRQGFVQHSTRSLRRTMEPVYIISQEVFPNPFSSQLRLKLSRSSASVSPIEYYSIDGLREWSSEFATNLSEVLLLDFDRLHAGKHTLRLITNVQVFNNQLVKN